MRSAKPEGLVPAWEQRAKRAPARFSASTAFGDTSAVATARAASSTRPAAAAQAPTAPNREATKAIIAGTRGVSRAPAARGGVGGAQVITCRLLQGNVLGALRSLPSPLLEKPPKAATGANGITG
jgi:hypothetical protein